jgi:hypothetical protein
MNCTKIITALSNALAAIDAAKAGTGPLTVVPAPGGVTVTGARAARVPVRTLAGEDAAALAALLGITRQADSTTLQDAHEINRLRSALAQATEEAAQFRAESIRFAAQAKDQRARATAMTPPGDAVEMERLRAETRAAGVAEARALAEAEQMAEALAQGEPSQALIKRAEKAEAQLAEAVAEARALGRSLDKIRAEQSRAKDLPVAAPVARLAAVTNAAEISLSFDPGRQTSALARAGVSLETLKVAFVWHFVDRRDPSKGGKWISRPLMVAEAQRLAELIFPEHQDDAPGVDRAIG